MPLPRVQNSELPSLPSELWSHIFSLATFVPNIVPPDVLKPGRLASQDTLITMLGVRRRKRSLATKRNLVRVCKRWHDLALPNLYETVFVGRKNSLVSLLRTLESSESGAAVGTWTRRFDMETTNHTGKRDLMLFVEILKYFPHISVLSVFGDMIEDCPTMVCPDKIVDGIAENCGPSLQVFDWMSSDMRLTCCPFVRLLRALPNLIVLRCPGVITEESHYNNPCTVPAMPRLRTLMLAHPYLQGPSASTFPSLTEVIIGTAYSSTLQPDVQEFLRSTGRTVAAVYYHQFHNHLDNAELEPIVTHCPNLQKLFLHLPRWHTFQTRLILPSVAKLELKIDEFQARSVSYHVFFRAVCSVVAPKLKIIQFVDSRNVFNLRDRHTTAYSEGVGKLAALGIQLQDHEGNPMLEASVG